MRAVDEIVYNNEKFLYQPKEMHKKIIEIFTSYLKKGPVISLLDVGCANGNFLYLVHNKLGHDFNLFLYGLDVHKNLLDIAKKYVPNLNTVCSSIEDTNKEIGSFDIVTCLGVMSIFDDFSQPFNKMYDLLKSNGLLIIATEFNDDPVDVIVRYRRSSSNEEFQRGWNVFSKKTVESILFKKKDIKYKWINFKMPFAVEKTDDPMRSWTISTESNPFQQVNGAQQMINQSILVIEKKD